MNRLYHLKQTLPVNISDNAAYENIEFVVLNYNSRDEMEAWIKKEMMEAIKSGKLRYIRTPDPAYFKMSHAKNMVTKFASGDIVCNIDADNFTGVDFARYVNAQFNTDSNIFLTGGKAGLWDLMGRVCLWKSDFMALRGYDEKILDYGYEDTDFYNRLRLEGRNEVKIDIVEYLKTIKHDAEERMKNGVYNSEIEAGLVLEAETFTKAFVLKKEGTFEYLTVVLSSSNTFEGLVIDRDEVRHGQWERRLNVIEFRYDGGGTLVLRSDDAGETFVSPEGIYHNTPKAEVCFYYSLLKGQMVFEDNLTMKKEVNSGGFGEGSLFEPFA